MDQVAEPSARVALLQAVGAELARATAATKCHACGCLRGTLDAIERSGIAIAEIADALTAARQVLKPPKYDCLGCDVCFPAVAANVLAEAFPDAIAADALCPTDAPAERAGWPPLPGEYSVLQFGASVAVCTLNSGELAHALATRAPRGLAIVGTMHTENLGIERVIRNVLANPNIRWLVLCGDDTRQLVGHLPGQSMASLVANGVDEKQRIVGAKGKRPVIKNLSPEHIQVFREQVQLVRMIGEQDTGVIADAVEELHQRAIPPFAGAAVDVGIATINAQLPQFFKSDPAGFLVVYPDTRMGKLVVEHYSNAGVLDCVVAGETPVAVYMEIIKRGLVSQLDHAAYLGRELANAERSLQTGQPYVQDRAPGEPIPAGVPTASTSCGPGCRTCH